MMREYSQLTTIMSLITKESLTEMSLLKIRKTLKKKMVKTSLRTWSSNYSSFYTYRDYEARPELDQYEEEGLDDEE